MSINQEKIDKIQNIEPSYIETIKKMDQNHLGFIIGLLEKQINYDEIVKTTGYSRDIINQIHRRYLPEQYLAMTQANDSIVEVFQTINKEISR